VQEDIDILL
jgi:hypothetical protein